MPDISGPTNVLGGVGGEPGVTFILFTHTNVTVPVALWAPLLTNQFDAFGVFSHTNAFNRAEPQRYYILQVPESVGN